MLQIVVLVAVVLLGYQRHTYIPDKYIAEDTLG